MKKHLLLLMTIFIYSISKSQNSGNDVVAISASQLMVVYAALDNPITIAVPGISPDKMIVTPSFGTLKGEKGNYILSIPSTILKTG